MVKIRGCRGIVEREWPELLEGFDRLEKKLSWMSEEVVRESCGNTFLTGLDQDEQRVLILLIAYLSGKAGVIKSEESLIRKYGPELAIVILRGLLGS
jgi:hypothetical protein